MVRFNDPTLDPDMNKYFHSSKDPRYLFHGSKDQILTKLREWVRRCMENNQKLMVAKKISLAGSDAAFAHAQGRSPGPGASSVAKTLKHMDYMNVLDEEIKFDHMRFVYLFETLHHRGLAKLEGNNGAWSFVSTSDPDLYVHGNLVNLEDKEHEEKVLEKRAEHGDTPTSKSSMPKSPTEEGCEQASFTAERNNPVSTSAMGVSASTPSPCSASLLAFLEMTSGDDVAPSKGGDSSPRKGDPEFVELSFNGKTEFTMEELKDLRKELGPPSRHKRPLCFVKKGSDQAHDVEPTYIGTTEVLHGAHTHTKARARPDTSRTDEHN